MRHIGFTGTREKLTVPQRLELLRVLLDMALPATLHHGDCVGSDAHAHAVVTAIPAGGWRTHGHPCTLDRQRAWCGCDVMETPKHPLDRNRDIVAACELLIACPAGEEVQRSGTWATVRHARKVGKPIVIVWPDGRVTRENEQP